MTTNGNDALIQVQHLGKSFEQLDVLKDITVDISAVFKPPGGAYLREDLL